jgi:hypothetical protein
MKTLEGLVAIVIIASLRSLPLSKKKNFLILMLRLGPRGRYISIIVSKAP